jgi:hypothetical protein
MCVHAYEKVEQTSSALDCGLPLPLPSVVFYAGIDGELYFVSLLWY